jgi:NitT/TauT family transport system substrate-binding protein
MHYIATHSAEDIADKMPRDYYGNDKALYVQALKASMPMFTADAKMPAGGPETVLKVLATYKPLVKSKNIDLAKTYTNAFVDAK